MIYECKTCGEKFSAVAFKHDWKRAGNTTNDIVPKMPINYCALCGAKLK